MCFLETEPVVNRTDRPDALAELRAAASVHVKQTFSSTTFTLEFLLCC